MAMGGARSCYVRSVLQAHPGLEEVIAEDPYDDGRWSVLEDWLLERDDPRAALVTARDPSAARAAMLPLLLGPRHADLADALWKLEWRGGYLRECYFAPQPAPKLALFDELLRAPAAALVRRLTIKGAGVEEVDRLAAAPCARSLCTLELSTITSYTAPPIAASTLAQLRRLEELVLDGYAIAGEATLRVTRLDWRPRRDVAWRAVLGALRLPALRALSIETAEPGSRALLDVLAELPLAASLETLAIGPDATARPGGPEMLRARYPGAFARLRELALL